MSRDRHGWRGTFKYTLFGVILALIALAHPLTVRTVGLDVWQVGQAEQDYRQAQQDEERLNRECQYAHEEAQLSGVMFDDLLAGRAELSVVAKQRWELNRDRCGIPQFLDRHCAGPSMEAKMAHSLVMQAEDVCPEDARVAVGQRLRQQYEAAYGVPPPGE